MATSYVLEPYVPIKAPVSTSAVECKAGGEKNNGGEAGHGLTPVAEYGLLTLLCTKPATRYISALRTGGNSPAAEGFCRSIKLVEHNAFISIRQTGSICNTFLYIYAIDGY